MDAFASDRTKRRALVIGGSIAGMCAARILSRHYDEVIIVERDRYPDSAAHRPGVPQSRYVHGLLGRGQRELERLFPGFERTVVDRGALLLDVGHDFAWLHPWGWSHRAEWGMPTILCSRSLLEWTIRDRVKTTPNLKIIEDARVEELIVEGGRRRRVTGVRARISGHELQSIFADLVVDASGRTRKARSWLERCGIAPPDEEVVDPLAGYACRTYRAPPPEKRPPGWWWRGIFIDPVPPHGRRLGVLLPIEDEQWLVGVVGFNGDYPPTDEAGYLEWLHGLRSPALGEAVRHAEPLSAIHGSRSTVNSFCHFERWPDRPDHFVALGDSVCTLNPVYGQGMTVAILSALELDASLRATGADGVKMPERFHRRLARFLQLPWSMAVSKDLAWPGTLGKRPIATTLMGPYLDAVVEGMFRDVHLARKLLPAAHLLASPVRFFGPSAALGALKSTARRFPPFQGRVASEPGVPPFGAE